MRVPGSTPCPLLTRNDASAVRPSSASHTASATAPATSSTVTRRPSSALSDVTPASAIPHGTIAENASRSQSQFSAKPCSGRRAGHPDADRGDLAVRPTVVAGHPHPGAAVDPAGPQPDRGAHRDQRILKAANEVHHVHRLGQPDDRVADQLTGAVPGDLAAAVGVDDRRAVDRALVGFGALARGVDRRVLEQQQGVGAAGDARLGQLALQLPGAVVVDDAQADARRRVCRSTGPMLLTTTFDGTRPAYVSLGAVA